MATSIRLHCPDPAFRSVIAKRPCPATWQGRMCMCVHTCLRVCPCACFPVHNYACVLTQCLRFYDRELRNLRVSLPTYTVHVQVHFGTMHACATQRIIATSCMEPAHMYGYMIHPYIRTYQITYTHLQTDLLICLLADLYLPTDRQPAGSARQTDSCTPNRTALVHPS